MRDRTGDEGDVSDVGDAGDGGGRGGRGRCFFPFALSLPKGFFRRTVRHASFDKLRANGKRARDQTSTRQSPTSQSSNSPTLYSQPSITHITPITFISLITRYRLLPRIRLEQLLQFPRGKSRVLDQFLFIVAHFALRLQCFLIVLIEELDAFECFGA